MSDIKKLKDLYEQYKKLKGYDDGGQVPNSDDSDDGPATQGFLASLRQAFNPNATPTPVDPELERQKAYARIRQQNQANFGYADGGEIGDDSGIPLEQEAPVAGLGAAEAAGNKALAQEDASSGGSSGGGGGGSSMMSMLPMLAMLANKGGKIPRYPNGGVITTDGVDLPEEEDEALDDDSTGEASASQTTPGQAEEEALAEAKANDEAQPTEDDLKQDELRKEIAAKDKLEEPDTTKDEINDEADKLQRDVASAKDSDQSDDKDESKDDSDEDSEDDSSDQPQPDATPAPNDQQTAFARLLQNVKPQFGTTAQDLANAQHQRDVNAGLQQLQKGSALFGAGMARANPSQALAVISDQDKNINMPIQKYQEQIANQANDPNSDISNVMRQYLQNKGFKVPDSASAGDLFKVAPFLAKDQSLQLQLQKTLMNIKARQDEGEKNRTSAEARTHELAEARKAQTNAAGDRQSKNLAFRAVRDMNNDPVIKPSRQNLASLQKSISLLENKNLPLTPQVLADAEQDIASGMQIRGMGGSEGKINRTQLQTVGRAIALAKQKYANQPNVDLRKSDPALVKQIYQTASALRDDYNTTIAQGKKDIASQYAKAFGDDKRVMDSLNQYINSPVGHHNPGDMVSYKGQTYQVGPDGDTLIDPKTGQPASK